jgi:hypothetical protein
MEVIIMFTKEQIKLVNDVDIWAQENNKSVDKKFAQLYKGDNGWEDVAKNYPVNFAHALAVAVEYKNKI